MPRSVLNLWQFAMAIQQKQCRTETETNLKMPEGDGFRQQTADDVPAVLSTSVALKGQGNQE